ncbi:MAG: RidA family protein [Elusimicrobiota bacterium]
MNQTKTVVQSDKAPKAVGPYSQAIRAGDWLFLSGQLPMDSAGNMAEGGVREQTRQVLGNLRAVLESAGLHMRDVVKTTVYMTDLSKFAEMNQVYGEAFESPFPARATVEVRALPKGAQVEIECVARGG